jgi:hypothetical protein
MLQVKIDQNLAKFENFIYFDLIWPPVVEIDLQTTNCTFFEIRNSTILIYRAISIFDLHMRIFNLQGLGAPDKRKKKNKHAEIDLTSHYSFLKVRRDQFLPNC